MENQESHFFASFAFGYAKGNTRKEALAKLAHHFRDEIKQVLKHAKGCYVWSCEVVATIDEFYAIADFQPQDVQIRMSSGQSFYYVNVTAKGVSWAESEIFSYSFADLPKTQ